MARAKTTSAPEITQETNGIPVLSALLHQAISAGPSFGTEKSLNQTKLPGIKMWLKPEGLVTQYKDCLAIIPSANVAIAVIDDGTKVKDATK